MKAIVDKGIKLHTKLEDRRQSIISRPGTRNRRVKVQPQINILHNIALDRVRKLGRYRITSRTDKLVAKVNMAIVNHVGLIEFLHCEDEFEIFMAGIVLLSWL